MATASFRLLFGTSVGLVEKDEWRRRRKVISNTFHFEFLKSLIPKVGEITGQMLKDLETKDSNVVKVEVLPFMRELLSTILAKMLFGVEVGEDQLDGQTVASFVNNLVTDGIQQCATLPVAIFGAKFVKMGIRSKDRDVLRRINIYREFG